MKTSIKMFTWKTSDGYGFAITELGEKVFVKMGDFPEDIQQAINRGTRISGSVFLCDLLYTLPRRRAVNLEAVSWPT